MKIYGREFNVKKRDFVVVEKSERHRLENKGKERLIFFTIKEKIYGKDKHE